MDAPTTRRRSPASERRFTTLRLLTLQLIVTLLGALILTTGLPA